MFEDLFITDAERVTIDLHDMELLEATYYLENYLKPCLKIWKKVSLR